MVGEYQCSIQATTMDHILEDQFRSRKGGMIRSIPTNSSKECIRNKIICNKFVWVFVEIFDHFVAAPLCARIAVLFLFGTRVE